MSRLNTIRLEEKEKREKEMLREIIEEADKYKVEFYRRWKLACENNKASNRKREKVIPEKRINVLTLVLHSDFLFQ